MTVLPAILVPSISPEIFSVEIAGFGFALRWYAMSYIVGFLISWLWFVSLMKRPDLWPDRGPPLRPDQPEKLLSWVIIGVLVGGRLGYTLVYNPAHYLANPLEIT